jgi:hypothetical protein
MMLAKSKMLPEVERLNPTKITKAELYERAIKDFQVTRATPADQGRIIKDIERQLSALPEELSLTELDQLRAKFRTGARDAKGLQRSADEYAALENASRDLVFAKTDDLPFDTNREFAKLNNEIKNTIAVQEFLDKSLRGNKVKGGRLGQYFGRTVGAIAGSKLGILGAIGGSELGGAISRILQNNQLGSSFKMAVIRQMTDDPKIIKQAEQFLKKLGDTPQPSLPPASSQYRSIIESGPAKNIPPRGDVPVGLGDEAPTFRNSQSTPAILPKKKDNFLDRIKNTPNKQGGFIKLPGGTPEPKPRGNQGVSLPNNTTAGSTPAMIKARNTKLPFNLDPDVAKSLRLAKGLSADDIMTKNPDIKLKRDVIAKDIHGKKVTIPEGEALTPYELKGNKVLLQDGETYIVSKSQYQNIKGNAISKEVKEFAPELKGTEDTVKAENNNKWVGDDFMVDGERVANVVKNEDGTWSYMSDFSEGSETFKVRL